MTRDEELAALRAIYAEMTQEEARVEIERACQWPIDRVVFDFEPGFRPGVAVEFYDQHGKICRQGVKVPKGFQGDYVAASLPQLITWTQERLLDTAQ